MSLVKSEPRPPTAWLEQLAREQLGVTTLETRHSDSLDFYELAVWQLRAALEAAFDAGAEAARSAKR